MAKIIFALCIFILLHFGKTEFPQDDFDVDFIAGYLDEEKVLLFYKNDGRTKSEFWLGINVTEASINGYSCSATATHSIYNTFGTPIVSYQYKKDYSKKSTASNLKVKKSSSTKIPSNIFIQYRNLTSFSMTNQRVAQLSDNSFNGGAILQRLDLSQNEIAELSPNIFLSVSKLKWLDLSFNKISKISSSTFNAFYNIETIILNDNQLIILYLSWLRPSIQNFFLNNNSIRQMNGELFGPNALEVIHLENNALQNISLLYSVTAITFNVSNNPLADQHELIKVNALEIDISNANVRNCYISQAVVELKANNNNISDILIPDSLEEEVEFSLTHLYLSDNYLTSLSNINHFTKLETVDLSHNLIEIVFMDIFSGKPNLSSLSLSHNKIHQIDFHTATKPISIVNFNIAYNRLETFKLNGAFLNLEELHLEGNRLQGIDTKMKLMAPNLVKIGLNNNQFSCSYLSTSVMFLRLEGITLSFLENTTSLLKTLNKYDDDVLGIGCLNSESVTTKPRLNVDSINTVSDSNLNYKIEELETRLLKSFNFKFNQIFNILNQTESATEN